VADYIRRITAEEGFDTEFEWAEGRLTLRPAGNTMQETT
jgi:hypothetical protein